MVYVAVAERLGDRLSTADERRARRLEGLGVVVGI